MTEGLVGGGKGVLWLIAQRYSPLCGGSQSSRSLKQLVPRSHTQTAEREECMLWANILKTDLEDDLWYVPANETTLKI